MDESERAEARSKKHITYFEVGLGLFALLVLALLAASSVLSVPQPIAPTTPDPGAAREKLLAEVIERQGAECRAYQEQFAEDTYAMYQRERAALEKKVRGMIVALKFTQAITIFAALLAALEIHDLLRRRRDKQYDALTYEKAREVKKGTEAKERGATTPPPSEKPRRRFGLGLKVFIVVFTLIVSVGLVLVLLWAGGLIKITG